MLFRSILHSISDENLLGQMMEYVIRTDIHTATIKANLSDTKLCRLLENAGFENQYSQSVLEIDLSYNLSFQLPQGFYFNAPDSKIDTWQWRLVIHRGFNHEGIPQEPSRETVKAEKHLEIPEYIKVFAIRDGEYAAHCGVWYNGGNTAYIEPVATVPGKIIIFLIIEFS